MNLERLAGLDEHEQDPFLAYLLEAYELDRPRLIRLAYFLLAHALIDRHLVFGTGLSDIRGRGGVDAVDPGALGEIIAARSRGTFSRHLKEAVALGLVRPDIQTIAEEINQGRDYFLHWEPGRFRTPVYQGSDVTTEAGLTRCLTDALKVPTEVPFGGGEPEQSEGRGSPERTPLHRSRSWPCSPSPRRRPPPSAHGCCGADSPWAATTRNRGTGPTRALPTCTPLLAACHAKITALTNIPEPGSLRDWLDWMNSKRQYDPQRLKIDLFHMKPNEIYVSRDYTEATAILPTMSTSWRCLPDTVDPRRP